MSAAINNRISLVGQLGASLVRWSCVIALIFASGFHVLKDFPPTPDNVGQIAVVAVQDDQGAGSAKVVAEACHICSVVSFVNASPAMGAAIDAPVIPKGRVVRLSMVTIPLTAPPPRA